MDTQATSDADLAQKIRQGDKQAEAAFVVRFQRGIRQIVIRATGNFALADELTQETLIITLSRLRAGTLEDPSKLAGFMAQTARNLATAEKRKARRRRTDCTGEEIAEIADPQTAQDGGVESESEALAVRAVLNELRSERDRLVLIRHYFHDEDRAVICQELGIRESTFHLILFRARKRFREKLGERGIRRSDVFSVILL